MRSTALGRPERVTWYRADGEASATAPALLGTDGIDLDPEPGSPAARREERIRRHPRRHTAVAVAAGIGKVVVPLLLGSLAVRLAISVPWPDVDLPDWQVPDWVGRLIDRVKYVWPVALAWVLARWEIKRRREQEALKAQLKAEALGSGQARTDSHPDRSPPSGARPGRDEAPTTADEGC